MRAMRRCLSINPVEAESLSIPLALRRRFFDGFDKPEAQASECFAEMADSTIPKRKRVNVLLKWRI